MPQALGTNALPTARAILERALESPHGIKLDCKTEGKAVSLRLQCYTARSRARRQSIKIYDETSPMYGNSPWDGLELFLDGQYLIVRSTPQFDVEELTGDED